MGNVLWKMAAAGERGDLVSSELPSDWVWCVLRGVTSQAREPTQGLCQLEEDREGFNFDDGGELSDTSQ